MEISKNCPQCGRPMAAGAVEGMCPECLLKAGLASTAARGTTGGGASLIPPLAELAPKFPQLEILECLGRGGMGVVYKARQPLLNRLVALKILAPEREKDPQFAARFAREAQALARLNHPNIVTVYDFGESGGLYFLLMEYVEGLSLRQLLEGGKLAPAEALGIVPRICEALQYAHEQGVVHRDVKPENVLLNKQGQVKIADFGVARIVGRPGELTALTQGSRQALGTPYYMAPEQLERPREVDHRADIYSLGVVFYEMLTGELPLGRFRAPSEMVRVDVRLDEVVLRALEKEPQRRYQQASQVKTDVETIAAGSGPVSAAPTAGQAVSPPPQPPMARLQPRVRWSLLPAVFTLVFAAVLGGFMIYGWRMTPLYESTATVQVLRQREPTGLDEADNSGRLFSAEDFNTQVRIMESATVANAVATRIQDADRRRLMLPYQNQLAGENPPTVQEILLRNRVVEPMPESLMIAVSFRNPVKEIAAVVPNYFVEEFIANNERINADAAMKLVDDFNQRASQQRRRVEEIRTSMNDMILKYGPNPDGLANDARDELKSLNQIVIENQRTLDDANTRWQLVQQQQADKKPLWELSSIADDAQVAALLKEYADSQATDTLSQTRQDPVLLAKQLDEASASAVEIEHHDLEMAQGSLNESQKRLEEIQRKALDLSRVQIDYDTLQQDLALTEDMYKKILSAVEEQQADFNLTSPSFRIVDHATPAAEPVEPNMPRLAELGAESGLAGGLVATMLAAGVMLVRSAGRRT